jgi:hypothetical protein
LLFTGAPVATITVTVTKYLVLAIVAHSNLKAYAFYAHRVCSGADTHAASLGRRWFNTHSKKAGYIVLITHRQT